LIVCKPKGKALPAHHARANTARSAVRSAVEHVFAGQKHRMKLFVRTVGIARAEVKIGMVNLAYNFNRLAWLDVRVAPACDRNDARSGSLSHAKPVNTPLMIPPGARSVPPRRRNRHSTGSSMCPVAFLLA